MNFKIDSGVRITAVHNICQNLRNIHNGTGLEKKLKTILNGKYCQYNYLKKISGADNFKDAKFKCPKNSGIILNGCNFMVPTVIDADLPRQTVHKDIVTVNMNETKTIIDNLIKTEAKNFNPLDFIKILFEKGVIDNITKKGLISKADIRTRQSLMHLYSFISNALMNGKLEDECVVSYDKKSYPLGIPKSSGADSIALDVLNPYYVSLQQDTSGSSKPHIIQQVNSELEDVEDNHAEIDVKIARNENVRRKLMEYGSDYIFCAPDTEDELDECFGQVGSLILRLNEWNSNDFILKWVERKLYKRAVALGIKRLIQKPYWSFDLEKYLPPARAQFQDMKEPVKWMNDYSSYTNLTTPIEYNIENVSFVPIIMEKYFEARSRSYQEEKTPEGKYVYVHPSQKEVKKWRKEVNKIVTNLRMEHIELELNYGESAFYVATAFLCSKLDMIRDYYTISEVGRKIPFDIGITNEMSCGVEYIFTIAGDILARNRSIKDGIPEIAGLFNKVDLKEICDLLKHIIISIKTMKRVSCSKEEYPFIKAIIDKGTLNMSPLYHGSGPAEGSISINLEKFKPDKAFRLKN